MKILISSCVYGRNVRWNGKNKEYKDIKKWAFAHGFELIPVCPEHELFSTPRPPIKLEMLDNQTKASMNNRDVTQDLEKKAQEIRCRHSNVVGFIGIAKSPTCSHSAGIRGTGKMHKGAMHRNAPFPTTEINSMKTAKGRMEFLDRVARHITLGTNTKKVFG